MEIKLETNRLILREIDYKDQADLFEMDADEQVHLFLGNNPLKTKDEALAMIDFIKNQYTKFGIARWAVVDKQTDEFIGWCGLKFIDYSLNTKTNFYDLGYRFKQKHWGKGYATEAATIVLDYGFEQLGLDTIYATAEANNIASKKVLLKLGFRQDASFDDEGILTDWFEMKSKYRKIDES